MSVHKVVLLLTFLSALGSSAVAGMVCKPPTSVQLFTPIKLPLLPAPNAIVNQVPSHERCVLGWDPGGFDMNLPAFDSQGIAFIKMRPRDDLAGYNYIAEQGEKGYFQIGNGHSVIQRSWPYMNAAKTALSTNNVTSISGIQDQPGSGVFDKNDVLYTFFIAGGSNAAGAVIPARPVMLSGRWNSSAKSFQWNTPLKVELRRDSLQQIPELAKSPVASFFYENSSSNRPIEGVPAVLAWQKKSQCSMTTTVGSDFCGRLSLVLPDLSNRTIVLSEQALKLNSMGGAPRIIRHSDSKNEKLYIIWIDANLDIPALTAAELADTSKAELRFQSHYSTVFLAEYDVLNNRLRKRSVLTSQPANDSHAQPGMVMMNLGANRGLLHVVSGSHNGHFTHRVSSKPIYQNFDSWSSQKLVNVFKSGDRMGTCDWNRAGADGKPQAGGCQTYLSMAIDSQDTIHAVYRLTRRESGYFGGQLMRALAHQRWIAGTWLEPKVLVYPNQQGYTNYYQRLGINRRGHLYLTYTNWRPYLPYVRTWYDASGRQQGDGTTVISSSENAAMLKSEDYGRTWFLATVEDLK